MTKKADPDRIWEIVDKIHICMFVTSGAAGLRGRPLDARPNVKDGMIYFLTDIRGSKDDELIEDDRVCMTFVDPAAKAYLSLTGTATVARDSELAKKYWKKTDEVWWPGGAVDSNLRVLCVTPLYAELWDGPADSAVARHEFAVARATGRKPNLGEKRKSVVAMQRGKTETAKSR